MGKIKEIYIEMIERDFNGDPDAHIQALAKQSCEEFSYLEDTPCPNCFNKRLQRNETEAFCKSCGQEFICIDSSLRFK